MLSGARGELHRLGASAPVVNDAAAEPDHLLHPIDDLDAAVGGDVGDDHVHRVGPDVDRGEPHGRSLPTRTMTVM